MTTTPWVAKTMADECFDALMDHGSVFTCREYDTIVDLYAALGLDAEATTLLGPESDHVLHEDADDSHTKPTHTCNDVSPTTVDVCPACQRERQHAHAA